MELISGILTRRSIRRYRPSLVPETVIEELLRAAMHAPSARNEQPWHFIVVDNRELLDQIRNSHPYAAMLSEAPLAIIVCGDTSLELSPGYWPVDCAAATQNLLLAAHARGLGSVWLGVYPRAERMDKIRDLFHLPQKVQPFAVIALGEPAENKPTPDRYKPERVKRNGWRNE
jgi:nitroreductase